MGKTIENDTSREIEELVASMKSLGGIEDASNWFLNLIPDEISSIPSFIDPSGTISMVLSVLNAVKLKRELNNIKYAVAYAIVHIRKCNKVLDPRNEEELTLSNMYFERCKETYQINKIKVYSNVWINGLLEENLNLDEAAYVFDLIATLTWEQLLVLKVIYDRDTASRNSTINSEVKKTDMVDYVAKELNIESSFAQQLCISLEGKGLLADAGIGAFDYPGPVNFYIGSLFSFSTIIFLILLACLLLNYLPHRWGHNQELIQSYLLPGQGNSVSSRRLHYQ